MSYSYPQLPHWMLDRTSLLRLKFSDEEDDHLASQNGEDEMSTKETRQDTETSSDRTHVFSSQLPLEKMPAQIQEYAIIEDLLYVFMVREYKNIKNIVCIMTLNESNMNSFY
jgi:hypothetical protein